VPPDPKPALRVHRGVAGVALQQATQEDAAGDDEKTQEDHGPPGEKPIVPLVNHIKI